MEQSYASRREDKNGVIHVPAGCGRNLWFNGNTYSIKVGHDDTDGTVAFVEASVPPGCGSPPHRHKREDEIFFLLSGELQFLDGERTFMARQGDFVMVPRGRRHCFQNNGIHTVKTIFLFTPSGFDRLFLEMGRPPVAGQPCPLWGPEEMARVAELAPRFGFELALDPDYLTSTIEKGNGK